MSLAWARPLHRTTPPPTVRAPLFLDEGKKPPAAAKPSPEALRVQDDAHPPTTDLPDDGALAPGDMARDAAAQLSAVADAVNELRRTAVELSAQAKEEALALGFMVAREIIGAHVDRSDAAVAALRLALRRITRARSIVVRVHPDDVEAIDRVAQETFDVALAKDGCEPMAKVRVLADPTLARGDCVVDTELGSIDGRVERRLGALEAAVRASLTAGAP